MGIPMASKPAHDSILVTFIDISTGKKLGEALTPTERLPESFEATTTLHHGSEDWRVEKADPMTAEQFRQTGRLRLELRRLPPTVMVDQKDILFSLPTIYDGLPPIQTGSTKLKRNVLELHEDDWRQHEFISASLLPEIEREIGSIRQIHEQHRQGPGFSKCHVRQSPADPIAGVWIPLNELQAAFDGPTRWLDGLAYQSMAGLIAGGWVLETPGGSFLYGQNSDGCLATLCIYHPAATDADRRSLAAFAKKHSLVYLDWCRALIDDPELSSLAAE
jgi:hypothetical protein